MQSSFIVTFIGDDKPGLVEALSSTIEQNGGNWNESRLAHLGGKFTGLILVSLPKDQAKTLQESLSGLSASGLSVRVTPTSEVGAAPMGRDITLTVIGPDRNGIVKEVSQALAQRQINVMEMESDVRSAPMSAEMIFHATIAARIPDNFDMDELTQSLEDIANAMTLEIDLE